MAKESTANTKPKAKESTAAGKKEYLNQMVPVFLHKDDNEYKKDLAVTINGTTMVIPRGKEVMVPRKYALIIEQSAAQSAAANDYMESVRKREK